MMKTLFSTTLFWLLALLPTLNSFAQTERFDINNEKTEIAWLGKKVIGSNHKGFIGVKEATFQVDTKMKTLISGSITINMNDITCTDLTNKEWNGKLIAHLKSDDFFSVTKYPTASFVSSKVNQKGNKVSIEGVLTIKDKKMNKTLHGTISVSKDVLKIKIPEIVIDRTKFDIQYGSSSFFDNLKDRAIENEFEMSVDLVADLY